MTHDELMALPENGGFYYKERILNGVKVKIPVASPGYAMSFQESDPFMVTDLHGTRWLLGRINGTLYRCRSSAF